jgi:hypothetical protein
MRKLLLLLLLLLLEEEAAGTAVMLAELPATARVTLLTRESLGLLGSTSGSSCRGPGDGAGDSWRPLWLLLLLRLYSWLPQPLPTGMVPAARLPLLLPLLLLLLLLLLPPPPGARPMDTTLTSTAEAP